MNSGEKMPIAIVGPGKIAQDQHIPALASSDAFRLAAVISPDAVDLDLPVFRSLSALVEAMPEVAAVSVCTPPSVRLEIVEQALSARLHVMLEKPTAGGVALAMEIAGKVRHGPTVFASWHSAEAPGVGRLSEWVADRQIAKVAVSWRENIRQWHPGQEWIFTSGFGVFDPGINALSILTRIFPNGFAFCKGSLVVPGNRSAPISGNLLFNLAGSAAPLCMELDFDYRGDDPEWNIEITASNGEVAMLLRGGGELILPEGPVPLPAQREYPSLYAKFAALIASRRSDVDITPLIHACDALAFATRKCGRDFRWEI